MTLIAGPGARGNPPRRGGLAAPGLPALRSGRRPPDVLAARGGRPAISPLPVFYRPAKPGLEGGCSSGDGFLRPQSLYGSNRPGRPPGKKRISWPTLKRDLRETGNARRAGRFIGAGRIRGRRVTRRAMNGGTRFFCCKRSTEAKWAAMLGRTGPVSFFRVARPEGRWARIRTDPGSQPGGWVAGTPDGSHGRRGRRAVSTGPSLVSGRVVFVPPFARPVPTRENSGFSRRSARRQFGSEHSRDAEMPERSGPQIGHRSDPTKARPRCC